MGATRHQSCWFSISSSITNTYGDGLSSLSLPTSPQSQKLMYTSKRLSNKKCNLMLSCDKSLCNVLDYWIAFVVHKNAQANFACARLNVTTHWQDSKFGLPPWKNSWLLWDWFWLSCTSHLFKCASIPPQLVCLRCFYMDGIKFYDTQMISGTNQCFHRKLTWVS